ncbi:hypothetical protein HDU87_001426 [Geranomyces variabilis]|uniref:Fatty acid desaturase domain-containing protein n=1 Tax=Geranomyces variabilis TaxID=109894 RepID=A0AAD5XLC0_9FUNG|nr:hypothetical protein HDU87_001426 [Geranomyces variabilis]
MDAPTVSQSHSVLEQMKEFRSQIPKEALAEIERPDPRRSIAWIAGDWLIVLAAYTLVLYARSIPSILTAMVLVAWAQRGLSNLLHDCSHFNLFRKRSVNMAVGFSLLATPLMSSLQSYRKDHTAHHNNLGSHDDPDHGLRNETALRHYREGKFDHRDLWSLFIYDMQDLAAFRRTLLGSTFHLPAKEFLPFAAWWLAVSLATGFMEGSFIGWRFLLLWHTTRCTLTYACYVFRELVDHSGLPSESILAFTRTSPSGRWLQFFLQPHDDNYHLLHHLLPRVPMSRFAEAHEVLMQTVESYRANFYDSYLFGSNPLLVTKLHVNHSAFKSD